MTQAISSIFDRNTIEKLVRQSLRRVLLDQAPQDSYRPNLVVNISARHVHLTQESVERLFGAGARLTPLRPLYQEGEFAAEQTVTIIGPRQRVIPNVRVLGPCRDYDQVELAFTDGILLGLDLPVRRSGDHRDTPGCWLMGPAGMLRLERGVIRAERHVHMSPRDAEYYGVRHGDRLHLRVISRCPTVLENLLCRVDQRYKLEVHLDTDEGNACDLTHATYVELFK
ncbi:MAG: phosphate propanoyltransferase [Gemmatales bacterium]|nr:phosphate propanoyltransferase [Gemmatales bacterium]